MEKIYDPEEETLDDLQLNGYRLIQRKKGFRFGADSVLLADFARIRKTDTVLDLGTGSGILLILLAGRGKGASFFGAEVQKEAALLAERNIRLNRLEDRTRILRVDIADLPDMIAPGSMDAVVCNPPYSSPGQTKNPEREKAISRHQEEDTLSVFLRTAYLLLKGKGRISLVYPAAGLLDLMTEMRRQRLEPKRYRMVYPTPEKSASLVLVEGIRDAHPTLTPMKPLIMNHEDGSLTNELKSIYHIEEQNSVC